jgi:hypothetical protein
MMYAATWILFGRQSIVPLCCMSVAMHDIQMFGVHVCWLFARQDCTVMKRARTRISKSSNQNAAFIGHDVLIGCFSSMSTKLTFKGLRS